MQHAGRNGKATPLVGGMVEVQERGRHPHTSLPASRSKTGEPAPGCGGAVKSLGLSPRAPANHGPFPAHGVHAQRGGTAGRHVVVHARGGCGQRNVKGSTGIPAADRQSSAGSEGPGKLKGARVTPVSPGICRAWARRNLRFPGVPAAAQRPPHKRSRQLGSRA